jgi:hypothetical protein
LSALRVPKKTLAPTFVIGYLTNYGQNAYFWTFWTFSHGGKLRNDTKPVLAGRQESKNRKGFFKYFIFLKIEMFF